MAELKMDFEKMAKGFIKTANEKGMFVGWWIPVSERLPENSDDVLITYYCGKEMHDAEIVEMVEKSPLFTENVFKIPHIAIAFYIEEDDGNGYIWAYGEGDAIPDGIHVTAWMPLPKPYEESEASE